MYYFSVWSGFDQRAVLGLFYSTRTVANFVIVSLLLSEQYTVFHPNILYGSQCAFLIIVFYLLCGWMAALKSEKVESSVHCKPE